MLTKGSYYRNDHSGYGASDVVLSMADQALLALVQNRPSLFYSEWASLDPSSSIWVEASSPVDYQAYAVSDYDLVSVASTASSEVTALAVLSPGWTQPDVVSEAFEGTPFSYVKTEAIYTLGDRRATPRAYFLYWLGLREQSDPKIGPGSLTCAAASIGGALAYLLETPAALTDRPRPATSFAAALAQQTSWARARLPAPPGARMHRYQAQNATSAPAPNFRALALVGIGVALFAACYHYLGGEA